MEAESEVMLMLATIDFSHTLMANRLPSNFHALEDRTGIPYVNRQYNILRARAGQYLQIPIPRLTYSDFVSYWESGKRAEYDNNYYDRRGRLLVFSLMALLEPQEEKWLHAFCDTVWEICSEPFWCIPAHFYDEQRAPLAFELYADHLDLFSCETAFALAEADALLAERLPEMVRKQIELNIQRRVFQTWLTPNRRFFFEHYPNNWASVCASSIGSAALYLLPDGRELQAILQRCMQCLDIYFSSFEDDGVCLEGAGYYSYGFGFFTCFAELLERRSNGKIDLFALEEKAKAIALSQQWFYISGQSVVNFADTRENVRCRMGLSQYLYRKTAAEIPPVAEDILDDECYRYCLALRDIAWTQDDIPAPSKSRAAWLDKAQWFLSRQQSLALAAKGGHNGQGHGHNDCGSFIVFSNGESCICDPGAGQYTADYFSRRRYEFLTTSARGHNVPVVNGCFQSFGASCEAQGIEVSTDTPVRTFSIELAACYGADAGLESLVRNISHDTRSNTITLTDHVLFHEPGVLCENFCGREEILLSVGKAVFTRNGQSVGLYFDSDALDASILHDTYINVDNQLCDVWFLQLLSREKVVKHTVSLTITPA